MNNMSENKQNLTTIDVAYQKQQKTDIELNHRDLIHFRNENQQVTDELQQNCSDKSQISDLTSRWRKRAPRPHHKQNSEIRQRVIDNIIMMLETFGPCPVLAVVGAYKNIYKNDKDKPDILNTEDMGLDGGIVEMFESLDQFFDLFYRDRVLFVKTREQKHSLEYTVEEMLNNLNSK